MVDLILRPSADFVNKPWALQLRYHDSVGETEYLTVAHVSLRIAEEIIKAGKPFWLFGPPQAERTPGYFHSEVKEPPRQISQATARNLMEQVETLSKAIEYVHGLDWETVKKARKVLVQAQQELEQKRKRKKCGSYKRRKQVG